MKFIGEGGRACRESTIDRVVIIPHLSRLVKIIDPIRKFTVSSHRPSSSIDQWMIVGAKIDRQISLQNNSFTGTFVETLWQRETSGENLDNGEDFIESWMRAARRNSVHSFRQVSPTKTLSQTGWKNDRSILKLELFMWHPLDVMAPACRGTDVPFKEH